MEKQRLSRRDIWSYGIGELPIALLSVTISSYITYYYTDVIGLSVALAGAIVMVCRIIEVATSPITGILVDRTNTKYGKARPFLRYTFIPIGIFYFLMFTKPRVRWPVRLVLSNDLCSVLHRIQYFCRQLYCAFFLPHPQSGRSPSAQPGQRHPLFYRQCEHGPAAAAAGGAVWKGRRADRLYDCGGDLCRRVHGRAVCLLLLHRERVSDASERKKISLREGFGAAVKNKQWLILCFIRCMSCVTWQFRNQGVVYYAKYCLGVSQYSAYILTAIMLSSVLVGFLITPLARRIGNRNCIVFGFAMNILVTVGFVLAGENIVGLCICGFLSGVGTNLGTTLFPVICAGQIDETERATGVRPQGLMTSFINVSNGVGSVLSAIIMTISLALCHYTVQGPVTKTMIDGIRFIFVGLPVVFAAITMVAALYLRNDRRKKTSLY